MTDNSQHSTESIGQVIHNKKVPKKKQIANNHLANSQIADSQIADSVRVSHDVNSTTPLLDAVEYATSKRPDVQLANRTRSQRINAEIDDYLFTLVSNGLVMIEYKSYVAKCIKTLGMSKVKYIVLDVEHAPMKYHKGKLLSFKLKGEMARYYKAIYDAQGQDTEQR